MTRTLSGRCLCGAVRFSVSGPVTQPVACHCRECQRQSGGVWVSVRAKREHVQIVRDRLAWVSVSPKGRRGFCRDCGGYLFWEEVDGSEIDLAFGALDDTTGLELSAHIFTAESRLPVVDGVPRFEGDEPQPDADRQAGE
ncbi:MAG: GFA family protein [Pseudomonadota bacterium]